MEAGLNVSINTPLCSLNRDYAATLTLAHSLGVRYATCRRADPPPARAESTASRATRLTPEELAGVLRTAQGRRRPLGHGAGFHKPRLAGRRHAARAGLCADPAPAGACLSNMAIAPDGTVLPCQSWLRGPALGNILHQPWRRIWGSPTCRRIRRQSAKMRPGCPLGSTPIQKEGKP